MVYTSVTDVSYFRWASFCQVFGSALKDCVTLEVDLGTSIRNELEVRWKVS